MWRYPLMFRNLGKNESDLLHIGRILTGLDNLLKQTRDSKDYSKFYLKNQLTRYFYALYIITLNFPQKSLVLDIGSYPSHIHKILLDFGYEVIGVDNYPERISTALNECKTRTIKWDIEQDKFPGYKAKFDAILLLEVIEHLHVNPLNLFFELENMIQQNGYLLLSTPNLLSLKNRINFCLGKYVLEHPLSVYEKLQRHGSRGHQRIYTAFELEDILDVFGFTVQKSWMIDEKTPFLSKMSLVENLPDDFDFAAFKIFFRENLSFKGGLRRKTENYIYSKFPGFSDSIYLLAQKNKPYDPDKIISKIRKADAWISEEKFSLK